MRRLVWGTLALACVALALMTVIESAEPASAQRFSQPGQVPPWRGVTMTPYYVPTVWIYLTPFQVPTLFPTVVVFTPTPNPTETATTLPTPSPSPSPTATATATATPSPTATAGTDDGAVPATSPEDSPPSTEPGA